MKLASLFLSTLALLVSGLTFYIHYGESRTEEVLPNKSESIVALEPIKIIEQQTQELDLEQLQLVISQLNQRVARLENGTSASSEQQVIDIVAAYIEDKELQEKEAIAAHDPFQALFQSLPEDYEKRLKTDPEYAVQMKKDLRERVLDLSLSEEERLQAMMQLQMTAGMLAEYNGIDENNELSNAIMEIANNTEDETTRIRALEVVTSGPDINPQLAPQFLNMVNNESNNYVRNIAANGLGMMMYGQKIDNESRQQLANSIMELMNDTSDQKLKSILEQNFGSEEEINEMLEHFNKLD